MMLSPPRTPQNPRGKTYPSHQAGMVTPPHSTPSSPSVPHTPASTSFGLGIHLHTPDSTAYRAISHETNELSASPPNSTIPKAASGEEDTTERTNKEEELIHQSFSESLVRFLRSFINLAPQNRSGASAARVERRITLLKSLYEETYRGKELLIKRDLTPKEYELLCEQVKKLDDDFFAYFHDKLRFDYRGYAKKSQLIIRMPSTYHEVIAGGINKDITKWFDKIEEKRIEFHTEASPDNVNSTVQIAKLMIPKLGATIHLSKGHVRKGIANKKDPDLSFRYHHPHSQTAGLVIEVAWSQRDLQLPDLAKRYIEETGGSVKTVIGFNLHDIYRARIGKSPPNQPATFSIWQARTEANGEISVVTLVKDKVFRDQSGKFMEGGALNLSLSDFISEKVINEIEPFENPQFTITAERLCQHYTFAVEEIQWNNEAAAAEKNKEPKLEGKMTKKIDSAAKRRGQGLTRGARDVFRRVTRSNPAPDTQAEMPDSNQNNPAFQRDMRLRRRSQK